MSVHYGGHREQIQTIIKLAHVAGYYWDNPQGTNEHSNLSYYRYINFLVSRCQHFPNKQKMSVSRYADYQEVSNQDIIKLLRSKGRITAIGIKRLLR